MTWNCLIINFFEGGIMALPTLLIFLIFYNILV